MSNFCGYRVAIINFDGSERHQEHLFVSPTFRGAYEYAKQLLTNEYENEIENYDPNIDIKKISKEKLRILRFNCQQDWIVKISRKRINRDWNYVSIVKVYKGAKKKKKKVIVPQKQLYTHFAILGHFTEGIPVCMKMKDTKMFLDNHLKELDYTQYLKYNDDIDSFIEEFDKVANENLSLKPGEPTSIFIMSNGQMAYKIGHLLLPGDKHETDIYFRWVFE